MSSPRGKKVFVAMSGGVDSSVAALLLKDQGYDVTGVFMRCYNLDGCAERDAEDARRVANVLKFPFYTFDFEEEYKREVVDYMIAGYRAGITPNPDVMCNKEIKFGLFLKKALALGADYIATGHYVRVKENNGSYGLFEAKDKNKDQSYFLWTLGQEQLKHCLFPVGDYLKPEVREMARKAGLPTAEKKDSQGVCFLGKVSARDFLKGYIPVKRGPIFTTEGKKIGEHEGAEFYTVGQRHLGITDYKLGRRGVAETEARYVAGKDIATNTVVVAEGSENPALYERGVKLAHIHFIRETSDRDVLARVRYRQPFTEAKLAGDTLTFKIPQKFVAPGQSAVFYSTDGEMLGGGVIV